MSTTIDEQVKFNQDLTDALRQAESEEATAALDTENAAHRAEAEHMVSLGYPYPYPATRCPPGWTANGYVGNPQDYPTPDKLLAALTRQAEEADTAIRRREGDRDEHVETLGRVRAMVRRLQRDCLLNDAVLARFNKAVS
jgi:hypothetical protein